MQKYLLDVLILIMLFTLSACGVNTCTVALKNGYEYVSEGEPKVNDHGWVSFKTTAGKKMHIKLAEVSVMGKD